ncbi:MAG: MbtF [Desulfovibrio sp. MES5]|uniref:MbtF n=1 Tax=Desulfovibrio sp. MES5 TaxID=1899016 RepID=UPI000B9C9A84|nr:MbtF [Desulfovibrio sp. MES5]OXS29566.1 MAG: MbtF [Desulfovibrio sp. MES5]
MRFDIFGKALRVLMPALCAALLLPACAAKETQEAPAGMGVTVNLRDVHRCSRISPEITVDQAPNGTDYYDVRLVEYTGDSQELYLGGGTWNNDGTGIIPEGGLTRHYRGPCPPSGQARDFAFVVAAMNKGSMQPLAVRLHRFTQE